MCWNAQYFLTKIRPCPFLKRGNSLIVWKVKNLAIKEKAENKHEMEKPELREKNMNQRQQINCERDTLKSAEIALKNVVVREVAINYPERPEIRYMSHKTASEIKELNEKAGRVVPVEQIKEAREQNQSKIQHFNKELHFVETEKVRLNRTEGYLNEVDKYNKIVEKYEKKLFLSKSAKQDYEDAVSKRDFYKDALEQEGVSKNPNTQ